MSVIIEPCGCEESIELTTALKEIRGARQEFDLAPGTDWGLLIEAIDEHIGVLTVYEYARRKEMECHVQPPPATTTT